MVIILDFADTGLKRVRDTCQLAVRRCADGFNPMPLYLGGDGALEKVDRYDDP
jgi:hypothetical protein